MEMKLIVLPADKHKRFSINFFLKLILSFKVCVASYPNNPKQQYFTMSLQNLKNEFRDEHVFLLHLDKHEVSYKLIPTLWASKFPTRGYYHLGIIKHFQYTKSNKFPISLQYLNKEIRKRFYFLLADKVFDGSGHICPKYQK